MAFKRFLAPAFCMGLLLSFSHNASFAETDLKSLSLNVANGYMVPAYQRLSESSQKQVDAWKDICGNEGASKDGLLAEFHAVNDQWQQVQHIAFGPITSFLHRDRLYHWPERRNAVSRALGKVMADQDSTKLEAQSFAKSSVAVQGLPALERLLFDANFNLADPYTCQLGQAIALNIASISKGTLEGWTTGEYAVIPFIESETKHPLYFENLDEIANRLFTQFLTGFQMITDQKLMLPMGKTIESAKPKRAEFWRSNRSVRNIIESTKGLQLMGETLSLSLGKSEQIQVQDQLNKLHASAQQLPNDLGQAVADETMRRKLNTFKQEVTSTRTNMISIFTEHAGLTVGFNSLDGD